MTSEKASFSLSIRERGGRMKQFVEKEKTQIKVRKEEPIKKERPKQ